MASRPKTLREARATYRSNPELAWWVFMRISGLILVPLVFGHLWMYNIAMNAGEIDFYTVVERQALSWVRIYDTFLLGFAMLHGVNGIRYSVEDYIRNPSGRAWAKIIVYTIVVGIFVFGIMTLWAFNYEAIANGIRATNGGH